MSYDASEFRILLDSLLPEDSFRKGEGFGGKAIWVRGGDVWTLTYAITGELHDVNAVDVMDERRIIDVSLRHDGVTSIVAVLKAVGAIPY